MSHSISALNQVNKIYNHTTFAARKAATYELTGHNCFSFEEIKAVLDKFVADAAKLDMAPIEAKVNENVAKEAAGIVRVRTFNHLTDNIARTDVEMHISEARKVMKENFAKRICTAIYHVDGRKQKTNYPNPYALCPTEAGKAWELWDTPSTYENDAAIYDLMQRQDY